MARDGGLPDRYWILEISPDLRERQRQRLSQLPKALFDRVEWLDRLPDAPWNGVLLANEVLDALPVARVRGEPSGLSELGVASHGRRPVEEARPARPALLQQWRQREVALAPGQEAEFCPGLRGWLDGVTAQLHAGVALFLDYGESRRHLYSAARPRGTLVAFHRHRIHNDPFVHLGLQDLTAWVDFTAVAEAALAAGLDVAGFTNQTCFLLGNGFEQHLCDWRESLDEESSLLAARTALKLVLPDDMGERFKCMALTRNYEGALGGFALRDFTDSL
jgi:SAM-dependent MidA family methyltransferase